MVDPETAVNASTLISINAGTFLSILFAGVFFLINVPIAWVLWGVARDQKRLEKDNEKLDKKLDREIEHLEEKHSIAIQAVHKRHSQLNNKVLNDFARKDEVKTLFGLVRNDIQQLGGSIEKLADKIDGKVDKQ